MADGVGVEVGEAGGLGVGTAVVGSRAGSPPAGVHAVRSPTATAMTADRVQTRVIKLPLRWRMAGTYRGRDIAGIP